MSMPQKTFHQVPSPRKNGVDMRGMLSVVTMFVSFSALTVSMMGAGKMVFDVFNDGLINTLDGIFIKVTVLGLSFLFGWSFGLASIRAFGNLVYPYIISIYAWACLTGVCVIYIKVIQKLYLQKYDGLHFWTYLIILLGGLIVLLFLHLLVEDHDLRPFAIPLLLISVIQLPLIIYRYVFTPDANGWMIISDFTIFFVMISLSVLMLMHIGILSPLREQISTFFIERKKSNNTGE